MKKRILSLVLVLAMLLGIVLTSTSCGMLYKMKANNAIKNTAKLEDYDVEYDLAMTVSVAGSKQKQKVSMDMLIDGDDGKETICVSYDGTKTYFDGGDYAYVKYGEYGYKMDISDVSSRTDKELKSILVQLPNEAFKDAEYVNKKGVLTTNLSLDEDLFKDVYAEFINEFEEGMGESLSSSYGASLDDADYSDCDVTIVSEGKYLKEITLDFNIYLEVSGYDVTVGLVITLTFNNPGEDVEVNLPKGCKDWDELNY